MGQDQRRNGHHRAESHVVQLRGAEAARDSPAVTAHLTAKASRALAIRAAKARWSGRKNNSVALGRAVMS